MEKKNRDNGHFNYNDYLSKGRLDKIRLEFIETIRDDRVYFQILEGDSVFIWKTLLFSKLYTISK